MGLICKFMINFELFLTHFFTILSLTKTEAGVQQSIGRRPQKAPTARDSDAECKSSGLFFLFLAFLSLTVPTNRGLHYQQQQPKVLLLVEFQVRNICSFFFSRSLKSREKYISFAQFVYFLREVCLLFNF